MNQEKIGKFIASCRKEQGFTQTVLAEKLGITDRASCIRLSACLSGNRITATGCQSLLLDTLNFFCNAFHPLACGGHFMIISLSDGSGFSGADGSV